MVSKYRVCVTGGAGFVGSHLVDRLLEKGFEVVAIDDLSTGRLENIKQNLDKKSFRFVNCDIRNRERVKELVKDVDAVFHEAALISVKDSIENPALANSINVGGTLNLLEASLNSDVERFVYASSSAVYGDCSLPQREDMTANPISPYGVSKLAAENYARVFHETYGLKTVCLRYFNVYGFRQSQDNPYTGVITRFMTRLLSGKFLTIYGDGRQSRDFVSVKDVVEANLLALESEKAAGEVFNVGTGKNTSINELASIILRMMNKELLRIRHAKARKGDISYSCADITKIRRVLGFDPKTEIEQELPRIIEWYACKDSSNE